MKIVKKLPVLFIIFSLIFAFSSSVYAANPDSTNGANSSHNEDGLIVEVVPYEELPQHIKEKIDTKLKSNQIKTNPNEHVKKEAYEVDLNGNKTSVLTLEQRDQLLRVPNDGYSYVFDLYDSSYTDYAWEYKHVETVRYGNSRSYPISGSYTQQNSVTKEGYVEGNASVSAKVNAFVGEVETTLGITAGFSRTYSKGSTYGVSFNVPANDEVYVTNYAVGVNSNGSWRYKRYSWGGTFIGYYYESAGGTVISKVHNNIEVY